MPGSNNGNSVGGSEGAIGRLGLGRGPFGTFDPTANGGPTGFGSALGPGGIESPENSGLGHAMVAFVKSTWEAVGAGTAVTGAAGTLAGGRVAAGASTAGAVVVVTLGGAYLVGSLLKAAEDKSDEAVKKASVPSTPANPAPTPENPTPQPENPAPGGGQQGGGGGTGPDPKHHHEGDNYPDPDGSGGGPVDPRWIPAEDGSGSGGFGGVHPLWSPANDGDGPPPNPTMIWDENGGGGTPNTIGQGVVMETIMGKGLFAGIIQVGPSTFRLM